MSAIRTSSWQVTARDLSIMEMVHAYNGCTTEQIHARFWPQGSALSACYRRVALLVDGGYLAAQRLPSLTGVGSGKRFLRIGPAGRALIAEREGIGPAPARGQQPVMPLFVQHHVAIGDFRLALEMAVSSLSDVRVGEWIDENTLRRNPMRVTVPGEDRTKCHKVALVPDGAFTLLRGNRQQRCFLEMDMGTIAPKRLHLKIRGYLLHETKPPTPIFFVAPTDSRAERISRVIQLEAKRLTLSPSLFFITTRDRVTSDTILFFPIWEQVGIEGRHPIIRSTDRTDVA